MKPMNLSYRILVWLYICPSENSTSRWTKLFRLGISIVFAMIFALLFAGSAVFCQQNVFTNLEIALFGILQMISAAALIHLFFTAHVLRHEFIYIFRSLQQIYEQGKSNEKKNPFLTWLLSIFVSETESRQFLETADKRAERIVKRFIYAFVIGLNLVILILSVLHVLMASLGYVATFQNYKPFKFT